MNVLYFLFYNSDSWLPFKHKSILICKFFQWLIGFFFWFPIIVWLLQFDCKNECWTSIFPRLKTDFTSKYRNQLLRDDEAKPNATCIHLLWILHKAKQPEQFMVVFLLNPNASVSYWDLHDIFVNNLNLYFYFTTFGKLKCIWLQI